MIPIAVGFTSMNRRDGPLAPGRLALSPAEHDGNRRTAEVEVLDRAAGLELVVEIAPSPNDVAPAERVAEARHRLPSQLGIAGAHIEVVGDEPAAIVSE